MKLLDRFGLLREQRKKTLAVLVDPDHLPDKNAHHELIRIAISQSPDFFLVGGSHLSDGSVRQTVQLIKQQTEIPVILFPGDPTQVCAEADGLLLLSMISGRNSEMLIGQHVLAAPRIREAGVEVLPTGYMLIDSGKPTSVSYISQTHPLPADKPALAASTAMAGEMLGLKLIYLEAGSGAASPVSTQIITAVRRVTSVPILVGGGISSAQQVYQAFDAGADVVVVGSAVEKDPTCLMRLTGAVNEWNLAAATRQS